MLIADNRQATSVKVQNVRVYVCVCNKSYTLVLILSGTKMNALFEPWSIFYYIYSLTYREIAFFY